jgi:hypothetical protein
MTDNGRYKAPLVPGPVMHPLAITAARRAGPREHGRQAARSKRDGTERAREQDNRLSHDTPP